MSLAPRFPFPNFASFLLLLTQVGNQRNSTHIFYIALTTMAEATPTFKLVLVGDGGTGKVIYVPNSGLRHEY